MTLKQGTDEVRIAMRYGLEDSMFKLDGREPLPEYLVDALMRYTNANWERISRDVIFYKFVVRAKKAGFPVSRKSPRRNAFEEAAERMYPSSDEGPDERRPSASTVESAYRRRRAQLKKIRPDRDPDDDVDLIGDPPPNSMNEI